MFLGIIKYRNSNFSKKNTLEVVWSHIAMGRNLSDPSLFPDKNI